MRFLRPDDKSSTPRTRADLLGVLRPIAGEEQGRDPPPAWIIERLREMPATAPEPLRPALPVPGPEFGDPIEHLDRAGVPDVSDVPEDGAPVAEERVVIIDL